MNANGKRKKAKGKRFRAARSTQTFGAFAVEEMILFALILGDRQEAALLVLAALFLFVFLPLAVIGFIIYRVVVGHVRDGSDDAITLDLNRPTSG